MKFWDSSAIIPLIVTELSTKQLRRLFESDKSLYVWWATPVEIVSAIARSERDSRISITEARKAYALLDELRTIWRLIIPSDSIRITAERLLRNNNLRAADALQLAAAISLSETYTTNVEFVSLDEKLKIAAEKEGFRKILPI